MRSLLYGVLLLAVGLTAGCSTVTITQKGTAKLSSAPTYKSSQPFFLGGLIGDSHIDVKEICGSRPARQMQSQFTFLDSFLTIITLDIYAPRTAKVWCGKEGA